MADVIIDIAAAHAHANTISSSLSTSSIPGVTGGNTEGIRTVNEAIAAINSLIRKYNQLCQRDSTSIVTIAYDFQRQDEEFARKA